MKAIDLIFYTWCLPQSLVGLVISGFMVLTRARVSRQEYKLAVVHKTTARFGVSLGKHIIIGTAYGEETIKHEYGHTIQSFIFGPLYLIVIGIPSVAMNILSRILRGKFAANYYSRWPENWADKLGKVDRPRF